MIVETKKSLISAALKTIATAQSAVTAPIVVWCGLDETEDDFTQRLIQLRSTRTCRILAPVPFGFSVPPGVEPVPFIPKLFRALHPMAPKRNRAISGGRGSGKSHGVATAVILRVLDQKMRVLCAREIMRSLRESVHHLLVDKIDALNLNQFFTVNDREITCDVTGSEIIFSGLFAHLSSLKSLENIALAWLEESECISAESLKILHPTLRAADSEFWYSLNPDEADAPIMSMIDGSRDDVAHTHVTFADNPFFPMVLEQERAYLERVDDDSYRHVWLGEVRKISNAIVFAGKWVVEEFEPRPEWSRFVGLDFGFSNDPSAAVDVYVGDSRLYIYSEFWALHCELDALSAELENAIPGSRHLVVKCDNSRPESISYLQRHGHPNAVGAAKWPGSILDGISYTKSFEKIIVHPRCKRVIEELKSYSYKIDRLTQLPLTEPQDRNNHLLDSLRYAIGDLIKQGGNNAATITAWYRKNTKVAEEKAAAEATDDPHHIKETVYTNGASAKPKALVPLWARPGVKVESL